MFAWQLREEFWSVERRVILSVPIRHRAINLYLLVLKLTAHLKLINSIVLHIVAAVSCLPRSGLGQDEAGQFKHFLQMVFIQSVETASALPHHNHHCQVTMDQIKSNSLNLMVQLFHRTIISTTTIHHKCSDHKPTSTVELERETWFSLSSRQGNYQGLIRAFVCFYSGEKIERVGRVVDMRCKL